MSDLLSENVLRNLAMNTSVPIVLHNFVSDWPMCQWDIEKWCNVFDNKVIPFRCFKRDYRSDEPCWERRCQVRNMTFKEFVEKQPSSDEWMYFDYKYLHQWFGVDTEIYKEVSWKSFGYPEKGAPDTTLWAGSGGAHTPTHQDTYGINIVAQVYGKKRWILFPPEAGGLKPTRVPYEESTIFSELNFYSSTNLEPFKGLSGARMVELSAGDALLVPRNWWHYVQNCDALNISLNVWIPHERDTYTQISEALIRILVTQVCKDLPKQTAQLIINPNEDCITTTPLSVFFLELETVVQSYLKERRKTRRAKRQRTREDDSQPAVDDSTDNSYDLTALLDNPANNMELAPTLTTDELIEMIKDNIKKYSGIGPSSEDESDGGLNSLNLTKAFIDSFAQSNVIDVVKENLLTRLADS